MGNHSSVHSEKDHFSASLGAESRGLLDLEGLQSINQPPMAI